MNNKRFSSVWDAIENTPEEAENMRLRAQLMMTLKADIARTSMTKAQAAACFEITQTRVADLMRGKVDLFALDWLVNMVAMFRRVMWEIKRL